MFFVFLSPPALRFSFDPCYILSTLTAPWTSQSHVSPSYLQWRRSNTNLTVSDFISGGSKITGDGDCSHEIKRCILLGRKVMTNLDSIFKSRDITLPTKVHLLKAMVFPVVMYGCESWTVKKAKRWRIDAFELLEKTLESPLDCKEIQPVSCKYLKFRIFQTAATISPQQNSFGSLLVVNGFMILPLTQESN